MKNAFTLCWMAILLSFSAYSQQIRKTEIAPGIYKLSIGQSEKFTPFRYSTSEPRRQAMSGMPDGDLPFNIEEVTIRVTKRGCSVAVPLKDNEEIYGFGLQMGSFTQRGLKKKPIVNDNPLNNLGYSHAPLPFYVSSAGYGILINTARYTTFYCGTNTLKGPKVIRSQTASQQPKTSTDALYKSQTNGQCVFIDVPNTDGIEVFIIKGPEIRNVVERYNLLSGGGCLPPMWGLGLKYRCKGDFDAGKVMKMADYFRDKNIPCDVIGLEPGWQTASYSCSYVWNRKRFSDPIAMCRELKQKGFEVNLWEHAYVHPSSPLYDKLQDLSGNFLVWDGLVPDFSLPKAAGYFGDYHKQLIKDGVGGFKLDECDNSNIGRGDANWGFPDMSVFPSGMDGEQMHQLFGSLYLRTMNDVFRSINQRTYQDYRSSNLFMSSVPATLYSDTYDAKEYIQMICNAAFGGLLWSPELRESSSADELFHRLQTVLLSPQAVVNGWYLEHPSWLQYDKEKNNRSEFLSNVDEMEQTAKSLINARMSLVPYLYAAFYKYHKDGTPPFRPLVMDFPHDPRVRSIDDQYMIGESILAAPLYEKGDMRKVYFPPGKWYDFNSDKVYTGGQEYNIAFKLSELPLFVKEGSVIPIAAPVQHISATTVFTITCNVYGHNADSTMLFEDDGISNNYEKGLYNTVTLKVEGNGGKVIRSGNFKSTRYRIENWVFRM